jgi:hypothetical protein
VSELLRSVMVECAELARAGRTPAPFYGCAQAAGGGAAMGVVQPPIAQAPAAAASATPAFIGPVIVYDRDATMAAAPALPTREPRPQPQPKPHHGLPMRRVA